MSNQSKYNTSRGNIIAGLGVLTALGGILILLDFYMTDSEVGEAGSGGGLLGAAAAIGEVYSLWFEMLMRSNLVTAISLLIIGGTFVYIGLTVKSANPIVNTESVPNNQPADINKTTVIDSIPETNKILDFLGTERGIVGIGAVFGFIVGNMANATISGLFLWTVFFGVLTWLVLTPSGKKYLRDIREQIESN